MDEIKNISLLFSLIEDTHRFFQQQVQRQVNTALTLRISACFLSHLFKLNLLYY